MIDFLGPVLKAPPVRLTGQKVWLRPPELADWKEWATLREESRDFLQLWEPIWPDDSLTKTAFLRRLRRQYDDWTHDLGYSFLIFRKTDNALVGGLNLSQVRRGIAQMATLGYWMGRPFTRQGLMQEAISLTLTYSFDTLTLHRIEAGCLPTNAPSMALLTKLGFTKEGLARQFLRINGQWADHVQFGILESDWKFLQINQEERR